MGRVTELADRPFIGTAERPAEGNRRPYHSLIPLKEILGELLETGPGSKKVTAAYYALIEKAGSELAILMEMGVGEIGRLKTSGLSGELLGEAIDRMRRGEVSIQAGYDGEYGVIRVFPPGVEIDGNQSGSLFEEEDLTRRRRTFGSRDAKENAEFANYSLNSAPLRLRVRSFEDKYTRDFNFDSAQEAIINHSGERVVIIAGPGTGKTAVIAARIAKLVKDGAEPASILALSFTVKAAASLRERVAAGEVNTATFHSFCCGVLRDKAGEAGIPAGFEIANESRRDELLREICKTAGKKTGPAKTGRYIENRKHFLLLPGDKEPAVHSSFFISHSSLLIDPETEALYARYRNRLRELNLLDYDDLIAGTVRLFAAKPEILAEYHRRFRHIFVDEYQDINFSQYILLRLLVDGGANRPSLWVIGDPNQAIYGFRGSDKRFIDGFTVDYPDASRF
jgi:hypothetical protein